MTVFSGCLKIIKSKIGITIMYFVIFTGISIAMQLNNSKQSVTDFQSKRMDIAFVDCDKSEISGYIYDYLNTNHNVRKMKNDKSLMQETLYYSQEDMVIKIPKGFGDKAIKNGGTESFIQITQEPGSYGYIYVEQQINRVLNSMRKYVNAGFSVKQAYKNTISVKKSRVNLIDINGNGGEKTDFSYMFRFYPYLAITVICTSVGMVLVAFKKKEIVRRMNSSATSLKSQNVQLLLVFSIFGIIIWLLSLIIAFFMYGRIKFLKSPNIGLYILNSFVMTITALPIAYFIGLILKKTEMINIIVTPVSLGISFISGVFVELSVLGDTVKKIGRFLPVYWYEDLNDMLSTYSELSKSQLNKVYTNLLLQLLFAVAFIGGALVVTKYRRKEK